MILQDVKDLKDILKIVWKIWKLWQKKLNVIFGPYRVSTLIKVRQRKSQHVFVVFLSLLMPNFSLLSWIVFKNACGQEDL